jgi:hypothetical protein
MQTQLIQALLYSETKGKFMSQVIIYQNPTGTNVCVCVPTGELHINEVLAKDAPAGAIIVDDSVLPQGDDAKFFDAWELADGRVTVNLATAKEHKLAAYNAAAVQEAQKRQLNTLAGLTNTPDDATWTAKLTADRAAITAATTTTQLAAI